MSTTSSTGLGQDESVAPAMSRGRIWLVFGGLMLGMLLTALDQTVSTAMYTIVGELDPVHGIERLPWVVTAYLLASVATQPLFGRFADSYGPKPLYLVAMGLFVAGSAWAGFAHSLTELIAARVVQGLGAGGAMVLAMAVTAIMLPPQDRAKYAGIGFPVMTVANVVGPLLGGFFTQPHAFLWTSTSWRWVFLINLPLGVLGILLVALLLRAPAERTPHRIDYLGVAFLVSGTSALLIVAQWGGKQYAWSSATILGFSAVGAILIALFVWRQGRAAEPIIPLRLFRNSTFRVAVPISFIVGFATFGSIIYVALYLQVANGLTPTEAGLNMLPMTLGMGVGSVFTGRLISKLNRYRIFGIVGSGAAAVFLGLLGLLSPDTPLWLLGVDLFLFGVGLSQIMQVPVLAVQNSVPITEMGTAMAGVMFPRVVGGAFGTAVLSALLLNLLSANLPEQLRADASNTVSPSVLGTLPADLRKVVVDAFVSATNTVFVVAALLMVLAFLLTLLLKEPSGGLRGRPAPPPAD
ncbi:MDR family MFS transporter [Nocardia arthritidis]|uniref:MFS transporter n=1 Tax=Nocardia arthritidis TaxID=228602 RepID=A0A6G9YA16_9NOCA|nr:MDR family MFS transporter [Nocardia arthritidis]QIS10052.1 MFS transporter [Nocardia arthritidis]